MGSENLEIHQIERNINKELGIKLSELRKSKGLSIDLLALKMKKSPDEISKFEAGVVVFTNDTITQFAFALNIDVMNFVN